jgi:MazG family protein
MSDAPGGVFEDFVSVVARLRAQDGCPWDREQTHDSLKPMTIEEAYEVLEAIDRRDDKELLGELGDLLLQVVFHAQIATEEGRFTIADVVRQVAGKMRRRHPHVFGGQAAGSSAEVLRNWEAMKAAERAAAGQAPEATSMLDGVSTALPSTLEAFQLTSRAARVGFDWPDVGGALDKAEEELRELRAAGDDPQRAHEEVGDLLMAAANVARLLGTDPESALKAANRKFRSRFRHVEARLQESGRSPAEASLPEMEGLWNEAKRREQGR